MTIIRNGEILQDELAQLRITASDLAEALPAPGPKGADRSFRQLESEERQELEQEAAKVDYHLRGESIGREKGRDGDDQGDRDEAERGIISAGDL